MRKLLTTPKALAATAILAAALAVGFFALPVRSDPCADRLAQILAADMADDAPVKMRVHIQQGTTDLITEVLWRGWDHNLATLVKPPGLAPTLTSGDTLYAPDGKGGWKPTQLAGPKPVKADHIAARKAQAAAVSSATCKQVQISGVTYDVVSGHIAAVPPLNRAIDYVAHVDPTTGFVNKSELAYNMYDDLRTVFTTGITAMPDLELPTVAE